MKPFYRVLRTDGRAAVQLATLKEAETEALRLAGQHPGETFEILRCVGVARTTEPSVFWHDGEGPAAEPPNPGEGHRLLTEGEVIRDGDEEANGPEGGGWSKANGIGDTYLAANWYPVRRPLYRMLEAGEVIHRGDEYRFRPFGILDQTKREDCPWGPVHPEAIGERLIASNVGHYRRPLETSSPEA